MKTIAYLAVTGLALVQGEHIRGKNEQKAGTFAADQDPKPDLIFCKKIQTRMKLNEDTCNRLSKCIGQAMKKGREERCEMVCSRDKCKPTDTNPISKYNREIGFSGPWTKKNPLNVKKCCFMSMGACDSCCLAPVDLDEKEATDQCGTQYLSEQKLWSNVIM